MNIYLGLATLVVVVLNCNAKKNEDVKGFTWEEKVAIVKRHNDLRSGVSPTATDMEFMTWDDDLASMAQEWSNGCDWKHGNPARDPKPYSSIGQNLWAGTGGYDEANAVQAWYDEVSDYTYEPRSCSKVCGHYTQVVWKDSYKVGCGIAFCPDLKGFTKNSYYITCNYGTAGNWAGEHPYSNGGSCSKCPTRSPTCDNKLCRMEPKCDGITCPNGVEQDAETCVCKDGASPTTNAPTDGGSKTTGSIEEQGGSGVTLQPLMTLILSALLMYNFL